MSQAMPFLTFQPNQGPGAAEAMGFYVDLFGGRVISDRRYPADPEGSAGLVMMAEFEVAGQRFRCSDSSVNHTWTFTPAVSVWVDLDTASEQDRVLAGLQPGGVEFMPLDDYGFGRFVWVADRFGVSWQLALTAAA